MKSFKTNRLIFAIGAMVIGIILLIWPGTSLMIIGRCIGGVLAIGGLVAAFLFWKDHETMSRSLLLIMAAVMLICGIVIILHPDELVKLIPTIMGILAVMSGLINIGETFLLNRKKYGKWWISLLVAAAKIAAGIFVIKQAYTLVEIITRIAGGVMVFAGASDLWVLSRLSVAEKKAAEQAVAAGAASDAGAAGTASDVPPAADAGNADIAGNASYAPDAPDAVNPPAAEASQDQTDADAFGTPTPEAAPIKPEPAAVDTPVNEIAPEQPDIALDNTRSPDLDIPDPADVKPGLVWDDGGADPQSEEVPAYKDQEEQYGEYKIPEQKD